jgi:hypothetical protein
VVGLVEGAGVGPEHVRQVGGDVEDDVHPGRPGAGRHPRGVVQQHLVGAHLEQHRRTPGQVGEQRGADQLVARVLAGEVRRAAGAALERDQVGLPTG